MKTRGDAFFCGLDSVASGLGFSFSGIRHLLIQYSRDDCWFLFNFYLFPKGNLDGYRSTLTSLFLEVPETSYAIRSLLFVLQDSVKVLPLATLFSFRLRPGAPGLRRDRSASSQ